MKKEFSQLAQSLMSPTYIEWVGGLPIIHQNESYSPAMGVLFVMAIENPLDALEVIYYVAQNCQDENSLDQLTAGPLETLLKNADERLKNLVNQYSFQSDTFKSMVEGAVR